MLSLEMDAHKKMGNVWRKIGGYTRDRLTEGKQELQGGYCWDFTYDIMHGSNIDTYGDNYIYPGNTLREFIEIRYGEYYK